MERRNIRIISGGEKEDERESPHNSHQDTSRNGAIEIKSRNDFHSYFKHCLALAPPIFFNSSINNNFAFFFPVLVPLFTISFFYCFCYKYSKVFYLKYSKIVLFFTSHDKDELIGNGPRSTEMLLVWI